MLLSNKADVPANRLTRLMLMPWKTCWMKLLKQLLKWKKKTMRRCQMMMLCQTQSPNHLEQRYQTLVSAQEGQHPPVVQASQHVSVLFDQRISRDTTSVFH